MTDRTSPQPSAEDDLTAEFWGSSPDWQTTRRNHLTRPRDRTGQVERTRTHGGDGGPVERMRMHGTERTGPVERTRAHGADAEPARRTPVATDEREETAAVVRSVFRPVDERPHHPRRSAAASPVGARRVDIELQPRRPVEALADRLGIGAVDPLLLRLGVVVLIGVLLVPFALSLRGSSDAGDARLQAISADDPGESGAAVAASEPLMPGAAPADDAAESAITTAAVVPPTGGSAPTAVGTSAAPPSTAQATTASDTVGDVTQRGAYTMAGSAEAEPDGAMAEPQCAAVYVVSSGDYWLRLADGAGISLGDLLAANAASADTALYPGSEVCLPAGARMPSPPTTNSPTTAPPAVAAPTTATTNPGTATTAAPTTVAPTTTAAPATAVAPSQVQALIREIWPDDLEEKALEVAYRESRYVATAYNGWCCYGIFQIHWTAHKGWLAGIGVTSAQQLFDARTNIELAYAIYVRAGGWAPWGG